MRRVGFLHTLFGRLVVAELVFGALAALGFMAVLEFSHAQYHRDQTQRQSLPLAEEFLREQRELFGPDLGHAASIHKALARLGAHNPAVDIYWLSPTGEILGASARTESLATTSVDLRPLERLLSGQAVLPVLGVDPLEPARPKVFSVAGVGDPARPSGYLYVILRGDEAALMLGARRSTAFAQSVALAIGVMIVAFASTLLIMLVILKPFRKMSRAIDAFRRSDFTQWTPLGPAPVSPATSEIDLLSAHLDDMAEHISHLLGQLKDDERRMREMFANISHDLRTPLTVIRGNLETLQIKGERIGAEERQAILRAALGQMRALGALVGRVFDLAKLQSPDFQLRREPVSLTELLQDVALKFAIPAQTRGLELTTDGLHEHAFVEIDVALLERVLDNLIGNSIEHSEGADRICVALRDRGDRYRVEVHDNGRGLAAGQVEALLRANETSDGIPRLRAPGKGLGLLIARRILALHGQTLALDSGTGRGTTFAFDLPKAGLGPPTPGADDARPSGERATTRAPMAS